MNMDQGQNKDQLHNLLKNLINISDMYLAILYFEIDFIGNNISAKDVVRREGINEKLKNAIEAQLPGSARLGTGRFLKDIVLKDGISRVVIDALSSHKIYRLKDGKLEKDHGNLIIDENQLKVAGVSNYCVISTGFSRSANDIRHTGYIFIIISDNINENNVIDYTDVFSKSDILFKSGVRLINQNASVPSGFGLSPLQHDFPLNEQKEDLLGHVAFARYLCELIRDSFSHLDLEHPSLRIEQQYNANHMLLYGPWGAGKSTILNFMRIELERTNGGDKNNKNWIVVEFNAWQNQHIKPPWWSLMDSVFQKTKGTLGTWDYIREYWWRFSAGNKSYIISVIIRLLLILFLIPLLIVLFMPMTITDPTNTNTTEFMNLSNFVNYIINYADKIDKIKLAICTILITISAILAAIYKAIRYLSLSSARAAQNYTKSVTDPMGEIKRRFEGLIDRVKAKYHVAIFIDDLDRCHSSYVVELLEGIQTLFYQAPVAFVIAADHRWLNASYEHIYEKLYDRVNEPGKSLGTLFLEKVFHFSTPMPRITENVKQRYWSYLLNVKPEKMYSDVDTARELAKNEISRAKSEEELLSLVDKYKKRGYFIEQRAIIEEAVLRLATPNIADNIERSLLSFAKFLEPNPRSMKHLVNAYSANRVLAFLSEVDVDHDQLVLWTILSMRWPKLADYLEIHPDKLDNIGKDEFADIPYELKALISPEVQDIMHDGFRLKIDTIKKCSQLHA